MAVKTYQEHSSPLVRSQKTTDQGGWPNGRANGAMDPPARVPTELPGGLLGPWARAFETSPGCWARRSDEPCLTGALRQLAGADMGPGCG